MTVLGAMSLRGMVATMTIGEATDAEIFRAYVDRLLCPALQPGCIMAHNWVSSWPAMARSFVLRSWALSGGQLFGTHARLVPASVPS